VSPLATPPRFYAAYRRFAACCAIPQFQLHMRLGAETVVVFDNQRILHGRTAFSSARHATPLRGATWPATASTNETALLRRKLAAAEAGT